MNRTEAINLFISSIGRNDGIRAVSREEPDADDLIWWTGVVFDPETDEDIGTAQFHEHWPEVMITWS